MSADLLKDAKIVKKFAWKNNKGIKLHVHVETKQGEGEIMELLCFSYVKNWLMLEVGQIVTFRCAEWQGKKKVMTALIHLSPTNFASIVQRARKVLLENKKRGAGLLASDLRFACHALVKEWEQQLHNHPRSGGALTQTFVDRFDPDKVGIELDWPLSLKTCRVRRDQKLEACHRLIQLVLSWMLDNEKQLKEEVRKDLETRFRIPSTASARLVHRIKEGMWPSHLTPIQVSQTLVEYPWSPHFWIFWGKADSWHQEAEFRLHLAQVLNYKTAPWEMDYCELYYRLKSREQHNHTFISSSQCRDLLATNADASPSERDTWLWKLCHTAQPILIQRGKLCPVWLNKDGIDDYLVVVARHLPIEGDAIQRSSVRRCEEALCRELTGKHAHNDHKKMTRYEQEEEQATGLITQHRLDEGQKQGISMALNLPLSVVYGSAGAGKSRLIQGLVGEALKREMGCLVLCQYNLPLSNLKPALTSLMTEWEARHHPLRKRRRYDDNDDYNEEAEPPDRKEEQRRQEQGGDGRVQLDLMTIASFLWRFSSKHQHHFYSTNNNMNDIKKTRRWDVVIIEEAGVVDLMSLFHTLETIREIQPHAHVCMVGDPFQLLPIGLGHPLAQVIQTFPETCTQLVEVHRQGAESGILKNARAILEKAQSREWKRAQSILPTWLPTVLVTIVGDYCGALRRQFPNNYMFMESNDCIWIRTSWVRTAAEARRKTDSIKLLQSFLDIKPQPLHPDLDAAAQEVVVDPRTWSAVVVPTNMMALRINTYVHHVMTGQALPRVDGGGSVQTNHQDNNDIFMAHNCLEAGCWVAGVTRVMTTEKTHAYIKNTLGIIMRRDDGGQEDEEQEEEQQDEKDQRRRTMRRRQGRRKERTFTVKTKDGLLLRVPVSHLKLAYGLTDHRVQGSEFKSVVVMPSAHWEEVDARWLYAAYTRAREFLAVICHPDDLTRIVGRGFRAVEFLSE